MKSEKEEKLLNKINSSINLILVELADIENCVANEEKELESEFYE